MKPTCVVLSTYIGIYIFFKKCTAKEVFTLYLGCVSTFLRGVSCLPGKKMVEVKKKVPQSLVNRMFHLLLALSNVLTMKKKANKISNNFHKKKKKN